MNTCSGCSGCYKPDQASAVLLIVVMFYKRLRESNQPGGVGPMSHHVCIQKWSIVECNKENQHRFAWILKYFPKALANSGCEWWTVSFMSLVVLSQCWGIAHRLTERLCREHLIQRTDSVQTEKQQQFSIQQSQKCTNQVMNRLNWQKCGEKNRLAEPDTAKLSHYFLNLLTACADVVHSCAEYGAPHSDKSQVKPFWFKRAVT